MSAQLLSTGALAAATAAALAAAGCSLSYNLGSMAGKDEGPQRPSAAAPASLGTSGASGHVDAGDQVSTDGMLAGSDLVHAHIALDEAFSKRGVSTQSTSWENPATGARGTITPISTPYQQEGDLCRDFLASYVHGEEENWLEGAACRGVGGRWTVKRLTPWKQA